MIYILPVLVTRSLVKKLLSFMTSKNRIWFNNTKHEITVCADVKELEIFWRSFWYSYLWGFRNQCFIYMTRTLVKKNGEILCIYVIRISNSKFLWKFLVPLTIFYKRNFFFFQGVDKRKWNESVLVKIFERNLLENFLKSPHCQFVFWCLCWKNLFVKENYSLPCSLEMKISLRKINTCRLKFWLWE